MAVLTEIRRYAWVYGGMPEGVFVSILGRVENWSITVDEDVEQINGLPESEFQGELDGVYKQFHWGVVSWSGTNGTVTMASASKCTPARCSGVTRGRGRRMCRSLGGARRCGGQFDARILKPRPGARISSPTAARLAFRPDRGSRSLIGYANLISGSLMPNMTKVIFWPDGRHQDDANPFPLKSEHWQCAQRMTRQVLAARYERVPGRLFMPVCR